MRLNFGDARLDALGHFPAVLAGEHHRRADDRFVAVERRRPGAELRSGLYFGHVFDEQRLDAAPNLSGRLAMSSALFTRLTARMVSCFAPRLMMPPPAFSTFCADEFGQFAERHAHCGERVGLGLNDELLFVAAALVDFGDARHGAEQRLDDVFLDFAQLDQLLQFRRRFVRRIGAVLDVVVKNFAEAGADRREFGQSTRRQSFQHALQPLGDKLARAIDVRAVLELQRHLREAELRQRTHFLHARQTGQFAFDRLRDEFFRFLGGERRDFGVDLHLRSRDVRHGVNRQMQRRPQTRRRARRRRPAGRMRAGAGKIREFCQS